MTFSPEENSKVCEEHSVNAEGSDAEDVEPTQCRPRSRDKEREGIMDLRITAADWMCIVMAVASGLALLSLVIWWDAFQVLLHRLT